MKHLLLTLFSFLACFAIAQNNTKPFVLGVIDELKSTQLSETRTLNIYLPPSYNKSDTSKYPVVYLLDGSADEDFIHITGLMHFMNFPWLNMYPEAIIVGISNVDRKRDFTYPTSIEKDKKTFPTTGSSEKFIAFLEKDLEPFIEKKYRVNQSKTIIGQSLGGLLATEILFKKPTLFNNYIIVSPSLWWDNESLLALNPDVLQNNFQQKTKVFVGVGNEGKVMKRDAKKLAKKLKASQNSNVNVRFEYFPKENHATILHQAVYHAFKNAPKG